MKYFLVFLAFAIGEIIIGEALKCQQCKAIRQTDCQGESVECENENDVCTKAIEYNTVDGDKTPTVMRGCTNFTIVCGVPYSVNAERFTLLIFNDCCKTDNCNSGPIEPPPPNNTQNGLYCKSCFKEDSYTCDSYEPIACKCNQGDCIEFSGDASRPGEEEKKYAFAGCATKGACIVGLKGLIGTQVANANTLSCPKENIVKVGE
ncbi:phospholipase A2 inhibitor and Ly6/PLAUR domain-containing protein-like [Anomaloglossus baeobatrachus]|uniref:phospholipase A2 inhibitor and Ly6/PLAUR domain-containing protein-like n=1 Tax=Anomaloglossus baeobatrachus TaxID=238106 RepID=UPI003F508916